jgi:hypothetical protein
MIRPFDAQEVFGNGAGRLLKSAARKTKHGHLWYRGGFSDVRRHIPGRFTRVPFEYEGKTNPRVEVICNAEGMPLSLVSPTYALIDHTEVVESLARALQATGREVGGYPAAVYLGDHGAKFGLRLVLSDMVCDPGDGHPVAGRVEVVNSVDRSMPLRISFGHHRLACSNGLMIFVTLVDVLEVHLKGRLDQAKVKKAIEKGLAGLEEKSRALRLLCATRIPSGFTEHLLATVAKVWGHRETEALKAALAGGVYRGARVPGLIVPAETVWGIYNTLTWVAGRSQDLARQLAMGEVAHRIVRETMKVYGIRLN